MGKYSDMERRPRDKYPTPYEAVVALLPHLEPKTHFVEPCAGDGRLVRHLEKHGHVCIDAFDIEPEDDSVDFADALKAEFLDVRPGDVCITNPPWDRNILHPLIDRWRMQMPTWFLFQADWAHTRQAARFLPYCRKIVSVGRVKWIEGSKMTGKESAAWYLFEATAGDTIFYGRSGLG
jgi:hypothetical protein